MKACECGNKKKWRTMFSDSGPAQTYIQCLKCYKKYSLKEFKHLKTR